jgi:hypothetical protein
MIESAQRKRIIDLKLKIHIQTWKRTKMSIKKDKGLK